MNELNCDVCAELQELEGDSAQCLQCEAASVDNYYAYDYMQDVE